MPHGNALLMKVFLNTVYKFSICLSMCFGATACSSEQGGVLCIFSPFSILKTIKTTKMFQLQTC